MTNFEYFFFFFEFLFIEIFDNEAQYECSQPLLDEAVIAATSSLTKRGPENARLHGEHINLSTL